MLNYPTTMFGNRVFTSAFIISLLIHAVILFQGGNFNFFTWESKKQEHSIQVHYLKSIKELEKSLTGRSSGKPDKAGKPEPFLKLPEQVAASSAQLPPLPPYVNKDNLFSNNKIWLPQKDSLTSSAFAKPEIAVKTKITLAPELDKASSPSYVAHSQIVREKIKRALYQNYSRIEIGQVYLSFVLSRDGYLRQVRVVEEKSSPSPYLREVALHSIRSAAPFPNFPKDLDYDQLSFNVIVSFEME